MDPSKLDRSTVEEAVSTATHMAGVAFALFGASLLIIKSIGQHSVWHIVSFSIYGFMLIALFTISALYHGLTVSPRVKHLFLILDNSAVFGLIIGTTTPICLILYRGAVGGAMLGVLIVIAAFGVTMRATFRNLPGYILMTLYLCAGWLPVTLIILDISKIPLAGGLLLLAGGLCYTIGATILGLNRPKLFPGKFAAHELWHIAVLAGALCHFIFMYRYVLPG